MSLLPLEANLVLNPHTAKLGWWRSFFLDLRAEFCVKNRSMIYTIRRESIWTKWTIIKYFRIKSEQRDTEFLAFKNYKYSKKRQILIGLTIFRNMYVVRLFLCFYSPHVFCNINSRNYLHRLQPTTTQGT